MTESEIIVVGGGPAGSTCAWKLRSAGRRVTILDRRTFPRPKPCAGWITPGVLADLEIRPAEYPHTLAVFTRLYFHFGRITVPLPTLQYAIRRTEFDHWLLQRAGVPVHQHEVRTIRRDSSGFVLDDVYRCTYLVGAGGTLCPVYRSLFRDISPRDERRRIVALEDEREIRPEKNDCHLWFGGIRGYSWYVPKAGRCVNIGTGVFAATGGEGEVGIREAWERLIRTLGERAPGSSLRPAGYTYYLRQDGGTVQRGNAFLAGDAAGLATRDMGEGIGPAVRSGILAAEAILRGTPYSVDSISRYSFFSLLVPGRGGKSRPVLHPARGHSGARPTGRLSGICGGD